jgi:GDP-L-fucose synthase
MGALIRKFHEAKLHNLPQVELWGTGVPRREFLYVDDAADAAVFIAKNYRDREPLNIGWGEDLTIRQIAMLVKKVIGYDGEVAFDASKPDGAPRKLMDVSRLQTLGWTAHIPLEQGVAMAYQAYLEKFGK